ncbi:uncharacterized protein EV154DRAFT_539090 [Mucor mucedo]|uniref:uncharacterized protein n=1 Tax=Mucor mucedo TaxID=29922 RepID=UPI00221E7233|nr:uncharacterized protein EV154DRAFT_539090 [Mucor mucedo]KAI7888966.1 hypothetical protein EV154DRAFT_539090 [Mucor mucedo]
MSGIAFMNSTNSNCFLPDPLDNDVTNMINKFTRAIAYDTEDMLLFPTKIVVGIFFNNCNYQAPEQLKNMENDFKIKYVVPFINAAFDVDDKLVVYWDKPLNICSNSSMKLQRRQTTDANFTTIDGMEIGIIEIKPFHTPFEMLEEDRVRLAEISKRCFIKGFSLQRVYLILTLLQIGFHMEYFFHEYNPDDTTATSQGEVDNGVKKYTFRLLKHSILPTFPKTFSRMSLSLESWFHFKKMMDTSIADVADVEKPYVYSDANKRFEPTVTLLKLGDG